MEYGDKEMEWWSNGWALKLFLPKTPTFQSSNTPHLRKQEET